MCVSCARGTYRTKADGFMCIDCPDDKTNAAPGSDSCPIRK